MRHDRFKRFAGNWTPIAASADLNAASPMGWQLDDVPVVVFRDGSGRAQALIDRCPHRSVKLSIGKLDRGIIQCAFHGWQFDGTGACRNVPLNEEANSRRCALKPSPAKSAAGSYGVRSMSRTYRSFIRKPSVSRSVVPSGDRPARDSRTRSWRATTADSIWIGISKRRPANDPRTPAGSPSIRRTG